MTKTTNPIWETIEMILEEKGIRLDDTAKLEVAADRLLEDLEEAIMEQEEQDSYPDDPYLYNGVSRSDFF